MQVSCGDVGQSGRGTVFYASKSSFACGENMASSCHYLEVAPNGWNGNTVKCPNTNNCETSDWGDYGPGAGLGYWYCYMDADDEALIPNASGTVIGSGYTNTSAMLTVCDPSNAAETSRGYNGGGMTDWSLPSIDELNALYYYGGRNAIGGFAADKYWSSSQSKYWSSSQSDADNAWQQDFANGEQWTIDNINIRGVRAVRAF